MAGSSPRVGVLAVQGDFARHRAMLAGCGAEVLDVRRPADLEGLSGLVLPGGESTAMLKLLAPAGLEPAIEAFHRRGGALLGTCAGLILLAREVTGPVQRSLGLLDVAVERNGYGRQTDSFETELTDVDGRTLRGVFIRAPRIRSAGPEVRVLAEHGGEPVLVEGPGVLAATFHPELTADSGVHRRFLENAAAVAPV